MSESRCLKGLNWGSIAFNDESLTISTSNNPGGSKRRLCKLSLKKFTNSTVNKTDIVIDLNTADLAEKLKP